MKRVSEKNLEVRLAEEVGVLESATKKRKVENQNTSKQGKVSNSQLSRDEILDNNDDFRLTEREISIKEISLIKEEDFGIKVCTKREIEKLINFIKSPLSNNILSRIVRISFDDVTTENEARVQELLNLLSEKASELTNLNAICFGDIFFQVKMVIPALPLRISFLAFGKNFGASIGFEKVPPLLMNLSYELDLYSTNYSTMAMLKAFRAQAIVENDLRLIKGIEEDIASLREEFNVEEDEDNESNIET